MRTYIDDIIRRVFGPLRDVDVCKQEQDAKWADNLDWANNDYDLCRLLWRLRTRLDSEYRRNFGLRLDQLVEQEDLVATARRMGEWYQHAPEVFRRIRFYEHLYRELDRLVNKRARHLFTKRKNAAQVCVEKLRLGLTKPVEENAGMAAPIPQGS